MNNQNLVQLQIAANATYSEGVKRNSFVTTSVHSPTADVIVQVTNVLSPDMADDADWHAIGTGKFVTIPTVVYALRVKRSGAGTAAVPVYICSVNPSHE